MGMAFASALTVARPALQQAPLTVVPAPFEPTSLPADWETLSGIPVEAGVIDRVLVGPNGVYAVVIDDSPEATTFGEDGLYRGQQRVGPPVKRALLMAHALGRTLASDGLEVLPYPVLVIRLGTTGHLDRLRVAGAGQLAEAVWSHPGFPLRRSERSAVLDALRRRAPAPVL